MSRYRAQSYLGDHKHGDEITTVAPGEMTEGHWISSTNCIGSSCSSRWKRFLMSLCRRETYSNLQTPKARYLWDQDANYNVVLDKEYGLHKRPRPRHQVQN